jgi:hypothetical protein
LGASTPALNHSQAMSSKTKPGKGYMKRAGRPKSEVPGQQSALQDQAREKTSPVTHVLHPLVTLTGWRLGQVWGPKVG